MSNKICKAANLEKETQSGWKLREVAFSDRVEAGTSYGRNVIAPGGYSQHELTINPSFAVREPLFILERDTSADVVAYQERISDLETRLNQAVTAGADLTKLHAAECALREKLDAELAFQKQRVSNQLAVLEDEVSKHEETRTRFRKLESDLAKIRAEVGEARMREILAKAI